MGTLVTDAEPIVEIERFFFYLLFFFLLGGRMHARTETLTEHGCEESKMEKTDRK
jgi:hypothetical protein